MTYNSIEALLHLERRVIGIKLLPKTMMAVYETVPFETVKHKAYYCWLVKEATLGRAFKLTFDQFACETAGWVLGLAPSNFFGTPDENIQGWYQCGTFATDKVAQLIYEGIKPLPAAEAVLIAPLSDFPPTLRPDVVLMIGKPYAMMRIVQSYASHQGFAAQMKMSGMCGICFESTAHPLQTQSLSLSALCSGTRYFAKWGPEEMAASIPYPQLKMLFDGILKTLNPCEPDPMKTVIEKRLNEPIAIHYQDNYYNRKSSDL